MLNLKINENKTLKELKDKGFIFNHIELLYYVEQGIYLAFDLDVDNEYFLKYIGEELFTLINTDEAKYKTKIKNAINDLKKEGFAIDVKDKR